MAKSKKLTINEISKLNAKLDEKKMVYILEKKYPVLINKKFKNVEIQKLICDYLMILNSAKKNGEISNESMIVIPQIIPVLAVKYFTDIEVDIDVEDIENVILISKMLLNTDIVEECMNAFDVVEVKRLEKIANEAVRDGGRVIAELAMQIELDHKENMEKLNNEIENYSNIIDKRISEIGEEDANSEESE